MALTLITSPAEVNLSGNDIVFKVNTDNQYSTDGTEGYLGLIWSSGDSAADTFKLSWLNKEVVFICAATPDGSGTEYTAYTSGTVADWMELITDDLKANYLLLLLIL